MIGRAREHQASREAPEGSAEGAAERERAGVGPRDP